MHAVLTTFGVLHQADLQLLVTLLYFKNLNIPIVLPQNDKLVGELPDLVYPSLVDVEFLNQLVIVVLVILHKNVEMAHIAAAQ